MSDSTVDRVAQQTEEITRDVLERASPQMIAQAVDAAFARYEQKLADELANARTAVTGAMDDFATKEQVNERVKEFGDGAKKELKEGLDTYLDGLNKENARRQEVFDQQVQKVLALAQAAEARSIATQNEIAEMKGAYEQRFGQIEKNIDTMKRDIDSNVRSVAESARRTDESAKRMDATFAKFVDKSEKRIDKIEQNASTVARDVTRAYKLIDDIEEARGEDVKEVRRIEALVKRDSEIVRNVEQNVILDMTRMNIALYGDVKEKEPGMVADVKSLKSGLWWQAWIGTHPYKAILIAGGLYVAFLIVTAFVLNRPEIVARMIPLGSGNPN